MKNTLFLVILLSLSMSFPLIAGKSIEANHSNNSTVVFMRSSFVAFLENTSIYEITDGKNIFIGNLKNNRKIVYKTTPGKHTFMVASEAADFMNAELIAGKTYYSIVTPRPGIFKPRFSMNPIRNDGSSKFNTTKKRFSKWKENTKETLLTDKAIARQAKRESCIFKKKDKFWKKWIEKSTEELALSTLNPEDGV